MSSGLYLSVINHLLDVDHLPTIGRYQAHPEYELPADLHTLTLDCHFLAEEAHQRCLRIRRVIQTRVGAVDLLDARHHAIERSTVRIRALAVDPNVCADAP